jgi:hypothetical protein
MVQPVQIQPESVERLEREARQTLVALQRTLMRTGQDTAELSALRVQLRSYLRAAARRENH